MSTVPSSSSSLDNNNNDLSKGGGIDVQVALEILSQRVNNNISHTKNDGSHGVPMHGHNSIPNTICNGNGACPFVSVCGAVALPGVKTWGQHIDMMNMDDDGDSSKNNNNGVTSITNEPGHSEQSDTVEPIMTDIDVNNNTDDNDLDKKKAIIEKERAKRKEIIQETISKMSTRDLLNYLLNIQEQRVQTYRRYDTGLEQVLTTGNLTYYPAICAEATASFSVISDTINLVRETMLNSIADSDNNDNTTTIQSLRLLNDMIQRLQSNERDKLNNTAAYHLEKIRLQQYHNDNDDDDNNLTATTKSSSVITTTRQDLLQQSILSLQSKIQDSIHNINDILDEIKCTILDIDDDS